MVGRFHAKNLVNWLGYLMKTTPCGIIKNILVELNQRKQNVRIPPIISIPKENLYTNYKQYSRRTRGSLEIDGVALSRKKACKLVRVTNENNFLWINQKDFSQI